MNLDERLEALAKIIVDEARAQFSDDICIELFARGIIQVTRIQVERNEILKDSK